MVLLLVDIVLLLEMLEIGIFLLLIFKVGLFEIVVLFFLILIVGSVIVWLLICKFL